MEISPSGVDSDFSPFACSEEEEESGSDPVGVQGCGIAHQTLGEGRVVEDSLSSFAEGRPCYESASAEEDPSAVHVRRIHHGGPVEAVVKDHLVFEAAVPPSIGRHPYG